MRQPGKKETLLAYLGRGIAMLHLDARREGVKVPPQHVGDPHLRLNLSYRFGIPDLVIDDRRVQATLSFRSQPFQCQLPWGAIFGITSQGSGEGQVWPEDLPSEVMTALADQEKAKAGERGQGGRSPSRRRRASSEGKKRPALVAVSDDADGVERPAASDAQVEQGAEAAPAEKVELAKAPGRGGARASAKSKGAARPGPVEAAPAGADRPAAGGDAAVPQPEDPPAQGGGPRRGHLRLVR